MRELIFQPAALRQQFRVLLGSAASVNTPCLLVGEAGSGQSTLAAYLATKLSASTKCAQKIVRVTCAGPLGPVRRWLFNTEHSVKSANSLVVVIDDICASDAQFQRELTDWLQREPPAMRIVSTASTRIYSLIAQGDFSLQLYNIFAANLLRVPPLRERPDDLVGLATMFIERSLRQSGHVRRQMLLSSEATKALFNYHWPGNLSELQQVMNVAVMRVQCEGRKRVERDDIGLSPGTIDTRPLREAVRDFEQSYIKLVLRQGAAIGMTISDSCKLLGVGRTTLWRKLGAQQTSPNTGTIELLNTKLSPKSQAQLPPLAPAEPTWDPPPGSARSF